MPNSTPIQAIYLRDLKQAEYPITDRGAKVANGEPPAATGQNSALDGIRTGGMS
jgi:hypothetical protein